MRAASLLCIDGSEAGGHSRLARRSFEFGVVKRLPGLHRRGDEGDAALCRGRGEPNGGGDSPLLAAGAIALCFSRGLASSYSHTFLHLIWILSRLQEIDEQGTDVFREGDPGDRLYVLLHGRVVVVTKEGVQLGALDANKDANGCPFFGEMALMDGNPRMATVRTATPQCKLLILDRADFREFLAAVPDFKARLRRVKQLRQTESALALKMKMQGAIQGTAKKVKGALFSKKLSLAAAAVQAAVEEED